MYTKNSVHFRRVLKDFIACWR